MLGKAGVLPDAFILRTKQEKRQPKARYWPHTSSARVPKDQKGKSPFALQPGKQRFHLQVVVSALVPVKKKKLA